MESKQKETDSTKNTDVALPQEGGFYLSWSAIRKGALVTAIVAAVIAALATSIVSTVGQTAKSALDYVIGNKEIERLSESNRILSERIGQIEKDRAEDRSKLSQIEVLSLPLPSRDKSYCFAALQKWINERQYEVAFANLEGGSLSFRIGEAVVNAGCVGAEYSNATFITLSSAIIHNDQLEAVMSDLAGDLWSITLSDNVVFPKDEDWVSYQTYTVLAVARLTITYGELQAWRKGAVPSPILDYLTAAGGKVDCDGNLGEQVCRADFPLSSVAFIGPGCDCEGEFPSLEPFGSYYSIDEIRNIISEAQAEGARKSLDKLKFGPPAPDVKGEVVASEPVGYDLSSQVRVATFVIVSGRNFGERTLSSRNPRYVVNEMTDFLMKMPGIETDLDFQIFMRDWE